MPSNVIYLFRAEQSKRERIIPKDIHFAVLGDWELYAFNHLNKFIIIPKDMEIIRMKRGFMGKNGVHEEYVGEDYKDDKEYVYDDD